MPKNINEVENTPEIKRVTLHPLKADGTIDLDVNLYPKTLVDGIVDRDGKLVDIATQQELNLTNEVLNVEVARATDTESILRQDLDSETIRATAREAEIEANLNAEIERAETAETNLYNVLHAEIVGETERAVATEETLGQSIEEEKERAEVAEAEIRADLANEITRAKGVEDTLDSRIDDEVSRATEAEEALDTRLTQEVQDIIADVNAEEIRAKGVEADLDNAIQAEATRATNKEAELNTKIEGEISRATGVEETLQDNIDAEENARIAEDTTLGGRIDSEASTREAADIALGERIDTEISERQSADINLRHDLANETARATAAEGSLSQDIANETERAEAAEEALGQGIEDEESARITEDTNLQSQINAIESKADVVDVVPCYDYNETAITPKPETDVIHYNTDHPGALTDQDVIKVLHDESHGNATTYYRWVITGRVGDWDFVGSVGPYYTTAEADALLNKKLDDSQLKTSWSSTVLDSNIPSEKLVKNSLNSKANDSDVVHKTDNEEIAGDKTFSGAVSAFDLSCYDFEASNNVTVGGNLTINGNLTDGTSSVIVAQIATKDLLHITVEDYPIGPQGGTVNITMTDELSTNRKDYIRIYDGEDSTGTLLFESTGQVATPNPGILTITTGKMYVDYTPTIGMLCTSFTTTGNITPSSASYDYTMPYQKVFTVSGECTMSLTIDWDD